MIVMVIERMEKRTQGEKRNGDTTAAVFLRCIGKAVRD